MPLSKQVVEVLRQHRETMQCLGLNTKDGLVFVTPRTHGHLYDSGLEKVWKRSQRRVGLAPRRLYAQRHSFLSHALAMGNSVLLIWQQWQDIALRSCSGPMHFKAHRASEGADMVRQSKDQWIEERRRNSDALIAETLLLALRRECLVCIQPRFSEGIFSRRVSEKR